MSTQASYLLLRVRNAFRIEVPIFYSQTIDYNCNCRGALKGQHAVTAVVGIYTLERSSSSGESTSYCSLPIRAGHTFVLSNGSIMKFSIGAALACVAALAAARQPAERHGAARHDQAVHVLVRRRIQGRHLRVD